MGLPCWDGVGICAISLGCFELQLTLTWWCNSISNLVNCHPYKLFLLVFHLYIISTFPVNTLCYIIQLGVGKSNFLDLLSTKLITHFAL